MPSRGTYEINSREEGKSLQRDQSYKSCVLTMLIFILLCIFLVIASWPWKKSSTVNNSTSDGDSAKTSEIKSGDFGKFVTGSDVKIVEAIENNTTTESESTEIPKINPTTEQEIAKDNEVTRLELSTTLQKLFGPEMTTEKIDDTSQSILQENENTEEEKSTSMSTVRIEEESSSEMEKLTTKDYNLLDDNRESSENIETTKRPIVDYTSLQKLLVAKYFGNESSTMTMDDNMDWLEGVSSSTSPKTLKLQTNPTKIISTTETIETGSSIQNTGNLGNEEKMDISTIRTIDQTSLAQEIMRKPEMDICESGSCKQLASKILSYMNHSADPCDDFYEYACGGLEADSQINERDLSLRVYEKIAIQARKTENSKYYRFNDYYESCLKYEGNYDFYHRIDLAKEALEKVGKFYTTANWPGDFQGFTTLFANMLLINRPLLFDIVPDVNEKNPATFALKIGPAVDSNPFHMLNIKNPCKHEDSEIIEDQVDLDRLYESYKHCRDDVETMMTAVSQALKDLGIFENLKSTSQYLQETLTNIDYELIRGVLTYFPAESEIRESYRSKFYTVTTLGEFQADCKLLNWTQLINALTGLEVSPNTELQIYYKHQLTRAMKYLENFGTKHALELNNALLGLFAKNLYQDFVASRRSRDLERKCFHITTHFMETEASALYLSSFTGSEIQKMQSLMKNVFHELRETLRLEIGESEWAVEWGREVLLKKLDDMRMSIPEVSYINKNNAYELNMTDNYFENSLTLMKKYRSMIYSALQKNPNDPEQIWTFFASPFQSNTRTIYGLNLIVIPFGAIDWPILSGINEKFDYLKYATLGNLIAREIAHNFDTNGIRYWNGSRDSEFALMTDNDLTKTNYEDYINCQKYSMYQEPVKMSLPVTGQRLSFMVKKTEELRKSVFSHNSRSGLQIPSLALNERLSDAVGMRLAHDTLARLGKTASFRLPWLDLDFSRLFYLVYAQTHCTKASLTSSYVSLNENPTLPSRVRVFVTASNIRILGESWKCPEGSQLLPTASCGIFPHLEYRGGSPDPA